MPIPCVLDGMIGFSIIENLTYGETIDLFGDSDLDKRSPYSITIEDLELFLAMEKGLIVYKHGAATGTTSGRLVEIHPYIEVFSTAMSAVSPACG
jgi:hypothetical protein